MLTQEQQSFIAAFVGALIGSSKESHKNLFAFFISVVSGTASSVYLTPIIADSLHIADTKMMLGLSFLIGTLGLRAVEMITQKLKLNKQVQTDDAS